jgi:hypothetical protein
MPMAAAVERSAQAKQAAEMRAAERAGTPDAPQPKPQAELDARREVEQAKTA